EGDMPADSQYPRNIETMGERGVDRRGVALVCTVILLIPAFITLVADFVTSGQFSWSLIVVDSLFLVFAWGVSPFYGKKYHPSIHMALGFASTLVFLYLLDWRTTPGDWFWPLAAPITGALAVPVIGLYLIITRLRPPMLIRVALTLFAIGLFNVAVEFFVARFIRGGIVLNSWSIYVIIPCVLLGIAVIILDSRKDLKGYLKKRLFY
ncbi:MAG: hypothetical protein FWE86_04515, partial [Oscillospiraceae bacterium]|nr:hypothetical protein [Oscillospiraceae bacterium]